ncbi:MAG: monovalent cation/H+ antiporter subunit D family protein [Rhodobacteraceae bacterium]|nr:MAG: monovalent cation/H+ antiporter subunit D family protein [Paracoccaceae bacterium]
MTGSAELLPVLIVGATLLSAAAIFPLRDDQVRLRAAVCLAGPAATLALVGALIAGVRSGARYEARFPFLPGDDLLLQADALSVLFVALSSALWLVTTVYALGYMRHGPNRSRFFGFFALCVSATMGVALAGNMITFLVFYETLTLATYPLVVHKGDAATLRAGRTYLIYTLSGGAMVFLGTMLLHALQGAGGFEVGGLLAQAETRPSDAALRLLFAILIAGVGVKAALAPLHGWLPLAMVAPAPVSALLHAVAVVKAGAFGVVRVVYDVFGVTLADALGVLPWLGAAAAITIVWGSVLALGQDDLKRRLAYSTVSQVSYIALGASLAHPAAAVGAILHLIHQGIMKITLFFCAGAFAEVEGVKTVSRMAGLGRRMPWTMAAFTVAALGMIGVPPTAGFVTKWYLAIGALEADGAWVVAVLLISSGLNAAYFLPIVGAAWFRPPPDDMVRPEPPPRLSVALMAVSPVVTALLVMAAALLATSIFSPLGWAQALALREFGFER